MSEATEVQEFAVVLPKPELTPFEREREAYYRLLPDLLRTHRGLYVAIHEGQVVDSGSDEVEVVRRVLDRVKTSFFCHLVEVPERVYRSGIVRDYSVRRPAQ